MRAHAEKRWIELLEGAVKTVPSADFIRVYVAGRQAGDAMLALLGGGSEAEVIQFAEAAFAQWVEAMRAALASGTAIPTSVSGVVPEPIEAPKVEEPPVAVIEPEAAPVILEPVVAPEPAPAVVMAPEPVSVAPVIPEPMAPAPVSTPGVPAWVSQVASVANNLEVEYEARVGEVVDVWWLEGKPWMQRMYVDLGRVMLRQLGDVTETLNWLANYLRGMERIGRSHGDIKGHVPEGAR